MKKNVKFIISICIMAIMLVVPIVSIFIKNETTSFLDDKYSIYKTANATYVEGEFKSKVTNAEEAFRAAGEVSDKFGLTDVKSQLYYEQTLELKYGKSYRFSQLHEGYFVYGKSLSVTVDHSGNVLSVTGNIKGNIDLAINKNLLEPNLKDVLVDFVPYELLQTEMVVYEKENKYYFCYNLTLQSTNLYACIVDAYTGNLLDALPLADNLTSIPQYGYTVTKEEVNQKDAFNNNVSVSMEKYVSNSNGDTFYLLSDSSKNIYMADIQHKESLSGYDYYHSISGEITDSAAVTAYVNLIQSYDFYEEYLDVVGISDGNGGIITLTALVHFSTNYPNAAYVYTASTNHYFIFGDGARIYARSLSTGEYETVTTENFVKGLDVVGHEYTHAITSSIVGFEYLNESGALSEAYSDMFGAMIEADKNGYDLENDYFWVMGEDLFADRNHFIRNAMDPDIKNYKNKVPDCISPHDHGSSDCDNGGVHSNCDIFTYAVYKMYQKGVFNDIDTMANLLYCSLAYLDSTSTLLDSREALVKAAQGLNLGETAELNIKIAFADVGVGEDVFTYSFYEDSDKLGTPITVSESVGQVVTVPECTFEKSGKYFWYWTNEDGEILEAGKTLTMGGANKTFYAVWSDEQLSILEGKGTPISPYLINSANELKTVAYFVNNYAFEGKYNMATYEIKCDLDLKNELWIPIGTQSNPFEGTFIGGNYKIKNLNLCADNTRDYNGLFGVVSYYGYICDVVIESANINTQADYTGTIVGLLYGNINTCVNMADVSSTNVAGGLVGVTYTNEGAMISNSYNKGTISAKTAGGIVGVSVSQEYTAGENNTYSEPGYIVNSYNVGFVGGDTAGGICGMANGTYFVNCINNANIESASGIAGGIVGVMTLHDNSNATLVLPTVTVYGGIFAARSVGNVAGGVSSGALIGEVQCVNDKGFIYLEKNITLDSQSIIGNMLTFDANETKVVKYRNNKTSTDKAFDGDFDFDNLDYYLTDNWMVINGFTPYDFVHVWKIQENDMPVFADYEFWLNVGVDYINSLGFFESPFEGSGSATDPYLIKSAEQLSAMSVYVASGYSFAGVYFKQMANINLAGKMWIGIGMMYNASTDVNHGFAGTFDGNGYSIRNLTGTTLGSYVEDADFTTGYRTMIYFGTLFGITTPEVQGINSSTYKTYIPNVKNVILLESNVSGIYVGPVVSLAFSAINVENCYNINGIATSSNFVSGIVGYIGNNNIDLSYKNVTDQVATIKNCYSNAVVNGVIAGGILAYAENINADIKLTVDLINCVSTGTISGVGIDVTVNGGYAACTLGGIMGTSSAYETNFINCIFNGNVYSYTKKGAVGGILGSLGAPAYGNNDLNMSFVGCKVCGDLQNLADSSSQKIGALIGSASTTSINTVHITNIQKTQYLSKYSAFGKNLSGSSLTSTSYDGANNNAYNFESEQYFKSELFDTTFKFEESIINLLDPKDEVKVMFYVGGKLVKTEIVKLGYDASGFIPTREPSKYYTYEFLYWDTNLNFITGDTTVNAIFKYIPRRYTVIYKDGDAVYDVVVYDAGKTFLKSPNSKYAPSKKSDFFYTYTFVGWGYEGEVVEDMEVYAVYEKTMRPQGIIFLLLLLLAIFLIPIILVVRDHYKKNYYK